MAEQRATISGRVGILGPVEAVEVSAAVYDRYRELKALWGFNCDEMASLATDGGQKEFTESAILWLLELMGADADEMRGVGELVKRE